jgi:hypothetical protein
LAPLDSEKTNLATLAVGAVCSCIAGGKAHLAKSCQGVNNGQHQQSQRRGAQGTHIEALTFERQRRIPEFIEAVFPVNAARLVLSGPDTAPPAFIQLGGVVRFSGLYCSSDSALVYDSENRLLLSEPQCGERSK